MALRPLLALLVLMAGCGAEATTVATSTTVVASSHRSNDQGVRRHTRTVTGEWVARGTHTYAIRWTSPGTTWAYDGTLTLTVGGTARVEGMFHWRLVSADASSTLQSRVGDTAVEQIAGTLDFWSETVEVHTSFISDPTLVGPASYRISLEGQTIRGTTASDDDGVWDGVLEGVAID